jgi:Transposase DNA-binding
MRSLLDDTPWAVREFADAELGDLRRTQRVVELATALAQHPTASLPEACGTGAMLKAAYRFFSNDAIEPQDLLRSHIEATYSRLAQVPLVLAVQDTTEVDWTSHPATQGLGPLGHTTCQGLHVHSTLAVTPERVPLGLLAQQVWARDPADVGKRARRKQLPISQKESQKWLASLAAVDSARVECPTTRFISVGDREADLYDLLAATRPAGVELLLRAAWDRCVQAPERYVWATVAAQPVAESLRLQVPRRGTQPGREALLRLRFCPLTLCPPRHRQREGLPAVALWAVQVMEDEPPTAVEPIEWLLLTTVAVQTVDDAIERVTWYACRWGIEISQPHDGSRERWSLAAACGHPECSGFVEAVSVVSTSARRSVRRGRMCTPDNAPPRLCLSVPRKSRAPRRCRGHSLGPLCLRSIGGV